MKKIYIMYSNTYSNFSKFLNIFLKSEYTHISISIGDMHKYYSFGRKYYRLPIFAGFVEERFDAGTFAAFKQTKVEILEMEVTDDQYLSINNEVSLFKENENNYSYNLIGLLPLWLNRSFERKTHFACSQFVGYVLIKSGVHQFDKSWSVLKPEDIRSIKNLKTIYEGNAKGLMEDHIIY